jgi:glycosyltransferase involved in cell wall biosynthesis
VKILSISTNDRGGAGIAAYRLHQTLLKKGVDSLMLVKNKTIDDDKVIGPNNSWEKFYNKTLYRLDKLPRLFFKTDNKWLHSAALFSSLSLKKVKEINPDIVNLHWICGGFVSPFDLPKIKKPLVWTLHDAWPFAGASHFTAQDDRYRLGFEKKYRPASEKGFDLNRWVWNRKRCAWKNLKNITIVTPSRWLAKMAKESILFKNYPVEVIPNGIDTNIFQPADRMMARKKLNLPLDKKIIIFGAVDALTDYKKGATYLWEATRQLKETAIGRSSIIAVFGAEEPEKKINSDLPIIYLGKIKPAEMPTLYSSADVFCAPYLEDNFPFIILEAMACGTPTVAFNAGGVPDIITHQQDGYLAKPLDAEDLANGIKYILEDESRRMKMAAAARKKIEENFTLTKQAEKYLELYQNIINSQKNNKK